METSGFFLTLAGGAGVGYLFGRIEMWRLAKKLERHNIKPSQWEEPIANVVTDVVQETGAMIGRSVTS